MDWRRDWIGALAILFYWRRRGVANPRLGRRRSPLPVVEVVQVERKDVPVYGEWIGTLDGLVNADVRAQVSGYLMEQGYQEGAFVKKGTLLFQIDARPFQAALDQSLGQLAQAQARRWRMRKRCRGVRSST